MPDCPTVSVVVVSRGRPDLLDLCLTGVAQLDHPAFEVVVVACPAGADRVQARTDAAQIRLVRYDEPNISAARNRGVARAAGDIVAFIDDDAVPEPTWLRHLTAPFADPQVAAAGGYVRGRNGISFQWRARSVDARGEARPLDLPDAAPRILHPVPGRAIKTEGTNMAVRRDILAGMGGFDPGFRFYLDETDLNLRLAEAGHATAIVPLAQVHHGYAASTRRAADRTPRDLSDIGASMALFLRKHCAAPARDDAWQRFRAGQHRRLLRAMQGGPLGPDDVRRLMRGLDCGHAAGLDRPLDTVHALPPPPEEVLRHPGAPDAQHLVLSGWIWQRRRLRQRATQARAAGQIVTLILLSPTALYHRVRFRPGGWWEQTGGLWGRSDRDGPLFQLQRLRTRIKAETARLHKIRPWADPRR